jgi:hypothetical protein
LLAGVKRIVPSGLTVTLPCVGSAITGLDTTSCAAALSASESLARTSMSTAVLIGVEARSSPACGPSLTGTTLMVATATLLLFTPSVRTTLTLRAVVSGLSPVWLKLMARIAAS